MDMALNPISFSFSTILSTFSTDSENTCIAVYSPFFKAKDSPFDAFCRRSASSKGTNIDKS